MFAKKLTFTKERSGAGREYLVGNVRERTFANGDSGKNVRQKIFTKGDGGGNIRERTFEKSDWDTKFAS